MAHTLYLNERWPIQYECHSDLNFNKKKKNKQTYKIQKTQTDKTKQKTSRVNGPPAPPPLRFGHSTSFTDRDLALCLSCARV